MKVYISADMEGITGVANWNEVSSDHKDYQRFQEQMTAEVAAACEGAVDAGAKEIWVKDGHDTGRNIIASKLPHNIKLIREWSGHPFSMVQELDDSFHSLIMIGYHSRGGSGGNPLSHTMSSGTVDYLKINGRDASEFLLNAYTASMLNVPVAFVSGDESLCEHVKATNENIETFATMKGEGDSTISVHPTHSITQIKKIVAKSIAGDISKNKIPLPAYFKVEIRYPKHKSAYKASFYPNVKLLNPQTIYFETDSYFEVLRLIKFTIW